MRIRVAQKLPAPMEGPVTQKLRVRGTPPPHSLNAGITSLLMSFRELTTRSAGIWPP